MSGVITRAFLIDGDPAGLRTLELSNFTALTTVSPWTDRSALNATRTSVVSGAVAAALFGSYRRNQRP